MKGLNWSQKIHWMTPAIRGMIRATSTRSVWLNRICWGPLRTAPMIGGALSSGALSPGFTGATPKTQTVQPGRPAWENGNRRQPWWFPLEKWVGEPERPNHFQGSAWRSPSEKVPPGAQVWSPSGLDSIDRRACYSPFNLQTHSLLGVAIAEINLFQFGPRRPARV